MTEANRFPEFTLTGSPGEIGRQQAEALGEQVRSFCEAALEHVNRTMRVSRESAVRVAQQSLQYAEEYSPDMVEELRGIAEASRVSVVDLMLLQVRNQLQPSATEGCTSMAAIGQAGRFVAQNWDNDPALDPFTVVLHRQPAGKPALTTVGQAGLIGYIGFNDAGFGLCLNSLPAPSRPAGVPHYFLVRAILESRSCAAATEVVRRARRAIPANVMLITPDGPADLEITIDSVHLLAGNSSRFVAHTNHCLHPDLLPINQQFPELIQSHARMQRILDLAGEVKQSYSLPYAATPHLVLQGLRDHQGFPRSICRHPNDDPVHGFWCTFFSVIIEPDQRRMWVSRGTPCSQPYELYQMPLTN